jgi:hypothetical protein
VSDFHTLRIAPFVEVCDTYLPDYAHRLTVKATQDSYLSVIDDLGSCEGSRFEVEMILICPSVRRESVLDEGSQGCRGSLGALGGEW